MRRAELQVLFVLRIKKHSKQFLHRNSKVEKIYVHILCVLECGKTVSVNKNCHTLQAWVEEFTTYGSVLCQQLQCMWFKLVIHQRGFLCSAVGRRKNVHPLVAVGEMCRTSPSLKHNFSLGASLLQHSNHAPFKMAMQCFKTLYHEASYTRKSRRNLFKRPCIFCKTSP